jgi:HK97 family phage portal protein
VANWLTRLLPGFVKRTGEGQYRPGPYRLSEGWLSASAGKSWNWWQMGHSLSPFSDSSAMVEACVSAYAQTIAMCPGGHWRKMPDGGRERVTSSALSRILKNPNDYQSMSDVLLNMTRRLYENGEAFALAVRNNRGEIVELHPMRHGQPWIAGEDGSIFYRLYGNEVAEMRFDMAYPIPARDVLHVRLHTPRHALKGESPILSTVLDRAMAGAALNQQVAYYLNQARPSFMLETDQQLTVPQIQELREAWNKQTQGENAGGTPILAWGLKAKAVTGSADDGQLAEMLKMSDQNIALAFRVPLQVLGLGNTAVASTEALMSSWKASGLGFTLNHIEEAFGKLFGLRGLPDEYLEFDTNELLRSAFKDRIEGFARGVITGIFSPDEARDEFDKPRVAGGHGAEPRVQQQVVPLSYWADIAAKAAATPAAPAPPAGDDNDEADDDMPEDEDTAEARSFGVFSTALKEAADVHQS